MDLSADQASKSWSCKRLRDALNSKADFLYRIRFLIICNLCLQTSDLLFVMDLFQNLSECLERLHQSLWQLELSLQSQSTSKTRTVPHGYINITLSNCIRALPMPPFGQGTYSSFVVAFRLCFILLSQAKLCCQVINKGLPKNNPGEIIPTFRLLGLSLINKGLLESFLCSTRGFRQPVGLTVNSLEDIAPTVCLAMLNAEAFTGGPWNFPPHWGFWMHEAITGSQQR